MKRICVTYTSRENRRKPPQERQTTFCIEDDTAAAMLLELGQKAPFTFQDALFMGTRGNALALTLGSLEELNCHITMESDKILEITEAEK